MSDNTPEDTTPGSAPASDPVQGDPAPETASIVEPSSEAAETDDDSDDDDDGDEDEGEDEDEEGDDDEDEDDESEGSTAA